MTSVAVLQQPAPTGKGLDVSLLLVGLIPKIYGSTHTKPGMSVTVAEFLIKDIEARAAMGEQQYGRRLHTENGRNAMIDAYQELLDGAIYAYQAHLETPADSDLWNLFLSALRTAVDFRAKIGDAADG